MNDRETLDFHARLIAARSVSGDEGPAADVVEATLRAAKTDVRRFDRSVVAARGPSGAPALHLCSHLDTVPPTAAWTRDPFAPTREGDRIYGLGSNDAKASVAAMTAAFLRLSEAAPNLRVVLVLVSEEETNGRGATTVLPLLQREGLAPSAALIGEPTSLDAAIAQKGLMVCEIRAKGDVAHAAHARALGGSNAILKLARDLAALDAVDLGPVDPDLGPTTATPTVLRGGAARNQTPAEAACVLDVRVNPDPPPDEIARRISEALRESELAVLSSRLRPKSVARDAAIVAACRSARPQAKLFGSRGVSDWCAYGETPCVKIGPGSTERSHAPDEFVLASEVLEGARFYEAAARAYAAIAAKGASAGTTS
jgi:acetylornithine deacetylase